MFIRLQEMPSRCYPGVTPASAVGACSFQAVAGLTFQHTFSHHPAGRLVAGGCRIIEPDHSTARLSEWRSKRYERTDAWLRRGFRLEKSRRRDELAVDYGRYALLDGWTSHPAYGVVGQGRFTAALDDAEAYLNSSKGGVQ